VRKISVGDSVMTKWDEWNDRGERMIVKGTVEKVTRGHRSMVYDVKMADTNGVEKVRADQIS